MSSDRFEIDPGYPERERSGWQNCLIGCLVVAGIFAILMAGFAWWIANNWRGWVADAGTEVFSSVVDASELPNEEKLEVKEQILRLGEAFRENKVPPERVGMILEGFFESPLFTSSVVTAIERKYFDKSELTDEEKAQGSKDLRRFVRGMVKKSIKQEDLEEALQHIATKLQDGNWEFRQDVSDEQLRALLKTIKEKADVAEIPEEVEEIDPSEELRRIIDAALEEGVPEDAE